MWSARVAETSPPKHLNGTLWNLGLAVVAAKVADRLRGPGAVLSWINRALGGLFIALGVRVALLQR